jgi:hypothetical protein
VSNFIIAYGVVDHRSRDYASQLFNDSIRLPTDLTDVIEYAKLIESRVGGPGTISAPL